MTIMSDSLPDIAHLLFTENRTPKDILAEFFTVDYPSVNLLKTPRDQWEELLYSELTQPDPIQKYLDGADGKLTKTEIHAIEEALEKLYSVSDPFYVYYSLGESTDGKHKFILMKEE